ncbi:hypothetical protein CDAR_456182 [Caerostris darwini]|uniref:Uncharacterized protein n=1 Tax=Caerostris darwini TaxID=1538125 RepID=A0AAV4RS14_9ARAC|nr:hypothetical protein CDAR_456182 [Caerostris darwini]
MNLDKDAGFGTEDLDEEVLFAWECFWHIMCEFGSVMELKKIINLADDRTTLHVLQELRRIAPDKNITDEQALDDEYWKNEAESIACFLTDEEMEGIRAIDLEPYVEKVCDEDYEDKQESVQSNVQFADALAVNISDKLSLENVERVNSVQKTYLPSETGEAYQIDQQSNGHTKEFFVLNQFYNLL